MDSYEYEYEYEYTHSSVIQCVARMYAHGARRYEVLHNATSQCDMQNGIRCRSVLTPDLLNGIR